MSWLHVPTCVSRILLTAGLVTGAPVGAQQTEAPAEVLGEVAQADPSAQDPAAAPARRAGSAVDEIVVTARKREERIEDIPIAINAFTGDDLEAANIDDISDLQFNVPNVTFTKTNFTGASFSIRGIGSLLVAASGDAGTGFHVNGVPVNSPRIFETEYFDVERVEVLRGPQGTLYGRNSPAGNINVLTKKPQEDLGGYIRATYGDFDTYKLKGALNVPLGENAGLRLAGFWLKRDGYTENVQTGTDIDDRDLFGIRGTFSARFGENTDMTLMVSWFEEDDRRSRNQKQACLKDRQPFPLTIGCQPGDLETDILNGAATLGGMLGTLVPGLYPAGVEDLFLNSFNPSSLRKVSARFDPDYESDEFIGTFELNHRMGPLTFTSVTGYQNASVWSQTDYLWAYPSELFASGPVFLDFPKSNKAGVYDSTAAFDLSSNDVSQWSEELRVTSDFDSPFNFTFGGFIMEYTGDFDYFVYAAELELFTKLIGVYPLDSNASFFRNETRPYELKTRAVFGEAYYDLTDSTRLTAGARYTYEEKELRDRTNLITFPLNPYEQRDDSWTIWTGKLGIDQTVTLPFTDETMVYFVFSRGHKGGGFNPPIDPIFNVPTTFEPEKILSYELGTKNSLLDNRLHLNLTGFYYDYEALQISKIVARTSVNENIDAKLWGAELESVLQVSERLRLDLSVSYLDTEIDDAESVDPANPTAGVPGALAIKDYARFDGSNSVVPPAALGGDITDPATWIEGYPTDLDGNELANAPEWTVKVGGQYTLPVGQRYEATFRVDFYWQDDMFGRIFNSRRDEIDAWSQTDAQIVFGPADGPWTVELWGKNLADHDDVTGMYLTDASSGNFTNLFILEPRTYGVTVGYRF